MHTTQEEIEVRCDMYAEMLEHILLSYKEGDQQ